MLVIPASLLYNLFMKAIFITYDQAHHEAVIDVLTRLSCRGFTSFGEVQGRGSKTGDPHLGTHAWPSIASATITIVQDDRVASVLERLRQLDKEKPLLGLRAFVWNIESSI